MSQIIEVEEIIEKIQEGELDVIVGYKEIKKILAGLESEAKLIKDALKRTIEDQVCDAVSENTHEYSDFSITYRKKYNFEVYEPYREKKHELIEIENMLKTAVDLEPQGKSINDRDGCVVEPVPMTQTRVLNYRPKKKK